MVLRHLARMPAVALARSRARRFMRRCALLLPTGRISVWMHRNKIVVFRHIDFAVAIWSNWGLSSHFPTPNQTVCPMKYYHSLTAVACLLVSSCTTRPPVQTPSAAKAAEIERERLSYERKGREYDRESRERVIAPPRVGMTHEQVSAEYGRPLSISVNQRTEVWTYSFNALDSRPSSPFHDTSTNVRCTVTFGQVSGKVVSFNWMASNPVVRGGGGRN